MPHTSTDTWEISIFWHPQKLIPKPNAEYYILIYNYLFCIILYLDVPQNLHQNIYLCEQLELCQNGKDNYIFGYHQNSCHYIIFCGRFDNQQKIIFQQVCQNIIFHGLFWWLSKHNIWSSSKSIVWIIYFDSQSNLLPTEHPFNARSQTIKCPLTAHLVSSVVNHSPILKCNHRCRMIVIYLHANYLLTWFSLTSLTRIS